MSQTLLPTATELAALLYSAGMIAAPATATQAQADYDTAITAAAAEWGRVTGYTPFMADTVDTLRKFDPPGCIVNETRYSGRARGGERKVPFDNGLVSLTSMTTGVNSVSAGTVRTLGIDFYLCPVNAVANGTHYTHAEFVSRLYGSPQSVQVLGKWGYAAAIPDDAWQAILFMAATRLVPGLAAQRFAGMKQIRLGNDSWSFADTPWKGTTDEWTRQVKLAKGTYTSL